MHGKNLIAAVTCLFAGLHSSPLSSQGSDDEGVSFTLKSRGLNCFLQNYEIFFDNSNAVEFVAIDLCPETPDNPISAVAKNVASDHTHQELIFDNLLAITKSEARCLAEKYRDLKSEAYIVFPEKCTLLDVNQ